MQSKSLAADEIKLPLCQERLNCGYFLQTTIFFLNIHIFLTDAALRFLTTL